MEGICNELERTIIRQPHSGCHLLSKEGHWRESEASCNNGEYATGIFPSFA
jgi:hypothetical protein